MVRGRLWRCADPELRPELRVEWVSALMAARRAMRREASDEVRAAAELAVDAAKHALGERGPVWWNDGTPDFNRKLAKNTPYADWFAALQPDAAS